MSTRASEAERQRRARLAHARQELLAPVSAMAGYAQLLLERAQRPAVAPWRADLERIAAAARSLQDLVDRLLELEPHPPGHAERGDLPALQAELRTPLNAIKGYAELLLEELDGQSGEGLRADLEAVLREAEGLLAGSTRSSTSPRVARMRCPASRTKRIPSTGCSPIWCRPSGRSKTRPGGRTRPAGS